MPKKKEAKFAGWASQHKLEELKDQLDRSNRLRAENAKLTRRLAAWEEWGARVQGERECVDEGQVVGMLELLDEMPEVAQDG